MGKLTNAQIRFLETYVLRRKLTVNEYDLKTPEPKDALQPEGETTPAQQREVDGAKVSAILVALAPPEGATPEEAKAMRALQREAMALLTSPIAKPELDLATSHAKHLRALHDACLKRIEDDRLDLEDRKSKASEVKELIAAQTVAHASAEETLAITTLAAELTEDWSDPPSHDQIKAARGRLADLEKLVQATIQARDLRGQERLALIDTIDKVSVPEADAAELLQIQSAQTKARAALPEHPDTLALTAGRERLEDLRNLARDIGEKIVTRKARRDEIVEARKLIKPAPLLKAEAEAVTLVQSTFPALDGAISTEALGKAETALRALLDLAGKLQLAITERNRLSGAFVKALDMGIWGSGALVAEPGVPASLTDPLRLRAEKLASAHAALRLADAPENWPESDPGKLGGLLTQVVQEVEAITTGLTLANEGVKKIKAKAAEARLAIEATNVRALSETQKLAFEAKVKTAEQLPLAKPEDAEATVQALTKLANEVIAFQTRLRGLAARIAAVALTPANASPKEIKALADLHKLAVDGLAEVEA